MNQPSTAQYRLPENARSSTDVDLPTVAGATVTAHEGYVIWSALMEDLREEGRVRARCRHWSTVGFFYEPVPDHAHPDYLASLVIPGITDAEADSFLRILEGA